MAHKGRRRRSRLSRETSRKPAAAQSRQAQSQASADAEATGPRHTARNARLQRVGFRALAVLVVAYLVWTLVLFLPLVTDEYVFNDDARQQIAPLYSFVYPDRFAGDLLTDYMLAYLPVGFLALYRLCVYVVDPLLFSNILTFALIGLSWGCAFLIGKRLGGRFCALVTVLLVAHAEIIVNRTFGALPRGFGFPLMFLCICFWVRQQYKSAICVLILQALFYPPVFMIASGAFGLDILVNWRRWIAGRRRELIVFVLGVAVCGATLVCLANKGGRFGDLVTLGQAARMPEWSREGGRFQVLPFPPSVATIVDAARRGLESPVSAVRVSGALTDWHAEHGHIVFWVYLLVMCFAVFHLKPRPWWWIGMTASGIMLYFAARLLAFKLFLPERYVLYSLPVSTLLLFPLAWRATGKGSMPFPRATRRLLLALPALVFVVYPIGFSGIESSKALDAGAVSEIVAFIESMPEPTLIAGAPTSVVNYVPLFARKRVLINAECAHPLYMGYYGEVKERIRDSMRLYFATSIETARAIRDRYGVTHLVVNKRHLADNRLVPPASAPFFVESSQLKLRAIREGFYFARPPAAAVVFEQEPFMLIDLREL